MIGAGTGGYVAAIRAAQLGLNVAVVEKQKALGGTCLIWGCIPTKALLEHAHALKVVQQREGVGRHDRRRRAADVGIDMAQVHARKDRIVSGLTKGVEFLFKKNKIDWIKGTARLTGNGGVDVFEGDKQTLRARKEIIVATGSAPRSVPASRSIASGSSRATKRSTCAKCRSRIAIMGSGAVGVEFASIFRRFGSDVTIIELLPRLVPVEDEAVSAELEKSFRKQGITATPARRSPRAKRRRRRRRHRGAARRRDATKRARRLPAGRDRPRSGHDRARTPKRVGLQMEKGYIKVDAQYRTSVPGISAIGDVITLGGAGIRSSRTCRRPKASSPPSGSPGSDVRPLNYDHVPGCTYCDPEIGSVGLTEREAQERGYDVRDRHVSVRRARPREDGRRDRRVREDRRRQEVRRTARRPHDRPAVHRARRRSDARAAARSRPSKS